MISGLRTPERTAIFSGKPQDPRVAVEHIRTVIVPEDQERLAGDRTARIRESEDGAGEPVERVSAVRADVERGEDAELLETVPGVVDGVFIAVPDRDGAFLMKPRVRTLYFAQKELPERRSRRDVAGNDVLSVLLRQVVPGLFRLSPVDRVLHGADLAALREPAALVKLCEADGRGGVQDGAEVAEDGAGFHGRQLIAVAQQDDRRVVGNGFQETDHEGLCDHGTLVDDEELEGERVLPVVAERPVLRAPGEQTVDGGRPDLRDLRTARFVAQVFQLLVQRLFHAHLRLSGRGAQDDVGRSFPAEGEDDGHDGRLAGPGTAADDKELRVDRGGHGRFLFLAEFKACNRFKRNGFRRVCIACTRPQMIPQEQFVLERASEVIQAVRQNQRSRLERFVRFGAVLPEKVRIRAGFRRP